MQDPHLNVMPDFNSEAFRAMRDALAAATQKTAEEVVQELQNAWTVDNNTRIAAWDQLQQEQQEQQQQPEQQQQQPEQQQQPQTPSPKRVSKSPKKRSKLQDFETGKQVHGTAAMGRPSRYALKKIANFEYIELYYFTTAACNKATQSDCTISQDAFTLTKVNTTMALKPIGAYKASPKAVPDERLTWEEISIAKTKLLQYLREADWPEKHITTLASFYIGLDSHSLREEEGREEILIEYQAEVRCEWIDTLTGIGTQDLFDIGEISERRMDRISARVTYHRQAAGVKQSVNFLYEHIQNQTNYCVSFLLFLSTTSACRIPLHHYCIMRFIC